MTDRIPGHGVGVPGQGEDWREEVPAGGSTAGDACSELLSRGARHIDAQEYESACPYLEEAYRMAERSETLISLLGFAYFRLDHTEKALDIYDEGTRLYPKNDEFWSNRGAICANAERYADALESFRNALSICRSNPETWYRTGLVLTNLGRHRDALIAFETALHFNPDSPEAREGREMAERMVNQ